MGPEGELPRLVYSGIDKDTAEKSGPPQRYGRAGRPPRAEQTTSPTGDLRASPLYGSLPTTLRCIPFSGSPSWSVATCSVGSTSPRNTGLLVHEGRRTDSHDARVASRVSDENARLYDEVQTGTAQLMRRMNEISSVERLADLLISGGSVDEVLRSAAGEAKALTDASFAPRFFS